MRKIDIRIHEALRSDDPETMVPLVCLRCGKKMPMKLSTVLSLQPTHYSYCEDCLKQGLKLLEETDKEKRLLEPFFIIMVGFKPQKDKDGKIYAFRSEELALRQIRESERLMAKHGFSHLIGSIYGMETCLDEALANGYKESSFHFMENTLKEEAEKGE